ncbi:hypothetical protein A6R68_08170 [Neotoma lepida]|uniref:Uncharacterized protein n=1 Tax=Neotoma lepida TaxID=56216 RepID=A0A1A6G4D7_NEOLE|nr:hypothetical protein A6R68_08170 [Neotoma lepida]
MGIERWGSGERGVVPLGAPGLSHCRRSCHQNEAQSLCCLRTLQRQQTGKVVQVYRKQCVIYTEKLRREKANGTTLHMGIHTSKVITRLKLDKDRKKMEEGEAQSLPVGKEEGKYKEETIEKMQQLVPKWYNCFNSELRDTQVKVDEVH